ncbi:uncharacterized protein N7506_011942 [Penicillium brevicompactum]|uniref:uncharacterized protein n=1 Tax=Penicillium brevicompactum TaxID=5074 RepID=UPI00253FB7A2|nr:uncharacterized protein N7506_011942 [Penicillium brevicompactum]KAJ5319238.1 hypothetical protein N7506_011942 [Penicillium brevicompactum]
MSPPQRGHPTERPYIDLVRHNAPIPPYLYHEPLPQNADYERPAITPFAPRLPALGYPERSADPRYMPPVDNVYMSRQPLPQVLPLRTHQPIFDPRYHAAQGPASSVGAAQAPEHSQRSRTYDMDSQYSSSSTAMPSPVWSDKSAGLHSLNHIPPIPQDPKPQTQMQTRNPSYRMPHGFDKLLHHSPEPELPPSHRPSTQSRYHLHVRQQPIAARACGAGDRDRRPVDPPPIVQILLTDFDPNSQEDRDLLQDPRFTVGCLLFPVSSSSPWPNPDANPPRERERERERDRDRDRDDTDGAFMSPFYVEADPDPNSAPVHPSANDRLASPNVFNAASRLHQPATFFIFADLSIRSAGLYRLQFRLMNWGSVEDTGQSMPILAEAWSDPFRVYPAKDFPGMQNSSILAEGLKELGFVELKTRGHGKGKGKKRK